MTAQASPNPTVISLGRILSHGSVPTLPVVAMQLLELTSNPEVALKEIAALIQSDPGLASKVLKTVNSSFYGLPKPCPCIERAIVILGLKAVKSLVLGFSMVNLTNGMDEQVDLDAFWKHTILAAVGARQIAQDVGFDEPDEVFAAALMQDIGVLAMLAAYTEQYAPLISEVKESHSKLLNLERQRLGIDHIEVGTALAQQWKMPAPIVAGIRHHHDGTPPKGENETLIKCIVLGELVANAMSEEHLGQGFAVLYSTANAWFSQGEQDVESLLDQVQQSSHKVAKLLEQQIGEVPSAQELMDRARERMLEAQLLTQREAEQAQHDAMTDGLTGIPNRAQFDHVLVDALASAVANQHPVGVLFSDADEFKFVNDTYGHACGDELLVRLAQLITETVGEQGTVCRYGGEEFVVVLPGMDTAQAASVGEQIRRTVQQRPFDMQGVPGAPPEPLSRTVSIGVSSWQPGDEALTAQQLVQRADKAVYNAKDLGRNNVKCWGVDTAQPNDCEPVDETGAKDAVLNALSHNGAKQVLLIEDDPLAARLMQTMLEKHAGVAVDVKNDGRDAITYLRDCQAPGRRNPDLIISDLNIPGYNGLQIIRALRSNVKFKHIPIVVVTANATQELSESCLTAGANALYNKLEISMDLKRWCIDLVRSLSKAA